MNRVIRSRARGLAIVFLLSLIVIGCDPCSQCLLSCTGDGLDFGMCQVLCALAGGCLPFWLAATDNPEEFQLYCEEYPEECQEAFDSWVEAEE